MRDARDNYLEWLYASLCPPPPIVGPTACERREMAAPVFSSSYLSDRKKLIECAAQSIDRALTAEAGG